MLRLIKSFACSLALIFGFVVTPAHADGEVYVNPTAGTFADSKNLASYTEQASITQGEALAVRVSSSEVWNYAVLRIGNYEGGAKQLVRVEGNAPAVQPECTQAKSTGLVECPWQRTLQLDSSTWLPGLYVIRIESALGFNIAPFVVRSGTIAGSTLFKVGMKSLAAYNQFGDKNVYNYRREKIVAADIVSLDRPLDDRGLRTFMWFEVPVAIAVDRNLPNATYATDIDVHSGAVSLAGARSIVTSGHDEYWTVPERKAVQSAMKSGTNLFITGANTMYWRVRMQSSDLGANRRVVAYKSTRKDPVKKSADTTMRWRDKPKPNPESKLMGVQYKQWFDYCDGYDENWKVTDASWWGYANTGAVNGTQIPGLVGREVDQLVNGSAIPAATQVIAHGKYKCTIKGTPKKKYHDAVYITTASGAGLFATGTQVWSCAMNGSCDRAQVTAETNAFTKQVTDNVLRTFDQGPAAAIAGAATYNLKSVYKKWKFKRVNW